MKAKITSEYKYSPNGYDEKVIPVGEIVEGEIAKSAIAARCASRMMDKSEPLENKVVKPVQNKRKRK